ncbi:SPOC domain-containing protein [Ditylenchus destructor]|uniref:SPOC domain-containing protein n=1 Tax=Ditylenchus destructor TaxID=166010 RepID=A0AAD4RAS5_9BILA|nr:SPOC domain-containing protein [Ditylenchus destructor]
MLTARKPKKRSEPTEDEKLLLKSHGFAECYVRVLEAFTIPRELLTGHNAEANVKPGVLCCVCKKSINRESPNSLAANSKYCSKDCVQEQAKRFTSLLKKEERVKVKDENGELLEKEKRPIIEQLASFLIQHPNFMPVLEDERKKRFDWKKGMENYLKEQNKIIHKPLNTKTHVDKSIVLPRQSDSSETPTSGYIHKPPSTKLQRAKSIVPPRQSDSSGAATNGYTHKPLNTSAQVDKSIVPPRKSDSSVAVTSEYTHKLLNTNLQRAKSIVPPRENNSSGAVTNGYTHRPLNTKLQRAKSVVPPRNINSSGAVTNGYTSKATAQFESTWRQKQPIVKSVSPESGNNGKEKGENAKKKLTVPQKNQMNTIDLLDNILGSGVDTTERHNSHVYSEHCKICVAKHNRVEEPPKQNKHVIGETKPNVIEEPQKENQINTDDEIIEVPSAPPIFDPELEDWINSLQPSMDVVIPEESPSSIFTYNDRIWNGAMAWGKSIKFPCSFIMMSCQLMREFHHDLPTTIRIIGQMDTECVWSTVRKQSLKDRKSIVLLLVESSGGVNDVDQYMQSYERMRQRQVCAVMNTSGLKAIRDGFMFPLEQQTCAALRSIFGHRLPAALNIERKIALICFTSFFDL